MNTTLSNIYLKFCIKALSLYVGIITVLFGVVVVLHLIMRLS